MKILEERTEEWRREVACRACGSRLELTTDDLLRKRMDPRDEPAFGFRCPCCGEADNWILAIYVPGWVKR